MAAMPSAPNPKVIVITGIMAAGKSTVAQRLAERLDRSVHVRGDIFRRMIVSGNAAITPEGSDAMETELRVRYELSATVADRYVRAGYAAVVQDIIVGPELATYVTLVRSRPLAVVVLAPRAEVVAKREAERRKSGYVDGWTVEHLDQILRNDTPRIGLWLDTSEQTVEQTVDEILARIPESLVGADTEPRPTSRSEA
jgi:cytidylate kinase